MTSYSLHRYHSEKIKSRSSELGFSFCGISRAEFLEEEAPQLEAWLKRGMHGEMGYMVNHFDKRLDPRLLVDGAKSVVSLLFNYYPGKENDPASSSDVKISKYAWGDDYHQVVKAKLRELMHFIGEEIGEVHGRAFVDSAPVMDKAWARKSGLGWLGKNTNLINKQSGSFFFIAELIIDLELEPDSPVKDHCGTCTACIDACPTEAIVAPYVVDGSKCISYLTIELKDSIPTEFRGKMDDWIFGCDVCQDVCPWNRFSQTHSEPLFNDHHDLRGMTSNDWLEMTEGVFRKTFQRSAIRRTGWKGMQRNVGFVKGNE